MCFRVLYKTNDCFSNSSVEKYFFWLILEENGTRVIVNKPDKIQVCEVILVIYSTVSAFKIGIASCLPAGRRHCFTFLAMTLLLTLYSLLLCPQSSIL